MNVIHQLLQSSNFEVIYLCLHCYRKLKLEDAYQLYRFLTSVKEHVRSILKASLTSCWCLLRYYNMGSVREIICLELECNTGADVHMKGLEVQYLKGTESVLSSSNFPLF